MEPICKRWVYTVGFLAVTVSFSANAQKVETPIISVGASLSDDGSTLVGKALIRVKNDTDEILGHIPIRMYPNRFKEVNPTLDDRLIRWIYPSGESPGAMSMRPVSWTTSDGTETVYTPLTSPGNSAQKVDNTIYLLPLHDPLEPGDSGELKVDFSVTIPERRGRFGRWRGVVSLAGGWFPRPLEDLTGRDTTLPPQSIRAHVRLSVPARFGAVIHDRVFPRSEDRQVVEVNDIETSALVLVSMKNMEVDEEKLGFGKVIHVHQEPRNVPPDWKDTRGGDSGYPVGLPDPAKLDYTKRLFEVTRNTAEMVRAGAPDVTFPDRLVLVDIPAWDRMVQAGPGPVLVSDRIWRMPPTEIALWFHDIALARGVAAELLRADSNAKEPLQDRFITADLLGAHFAKKYAREFHEKGRTVEEIIGFASFLPQVDHLLYAPQVPFREVYAKRAEAPDQLRDEPWRYTNELPRGKRILWKLEDRLGEEETRALIETYLASDRSLQALVAERMGKKDAKQFRDQWYGHYPRVNYRVGKVEDIHTEGAFRHKVEIIREGEVISEPVTVQITDKAGRSERLTWDGRGRSGTVEWTSDAPLHKVRIDPDRRLLESADLTPDHPEADNFDPLGWRPPLISRIVVSGDAATLDLYVSVGLMMRRKYDISNSFLASGTYTPRSLGGSLGYLRHFGPKRHLNARQWFFGPFLGLTRFTEVQEVSNYLPDDTLFGATAGSLRLVLGKDNRSYFFDPRNGSGFVARLGYSAGGDDDGKPVHMGAAEVGYVGLFSPSIRNVFAMHAGALGIVGRPAAVQLVTLSTRERLQGFDIDETYGRVGLFSVFEYRRTLVDGAHITAPAFSWFDRFQGVLSAGGGTVSDPAGYTGLFSKERLYTEVGAGLRVHMLALGIQQYIIALDLAVPLTPTDRQYELEQSDGTTVLQNRAPFKIKFGIMQTF